MGAEKGGVERDVHRLEPEEVAERLLHERLSRLLVPERGRGLDEPAQEVEHLPLAGRDDVCELAIRDSDPSEHGRELTHPPLPRTVAFVVVSAVARRTFGRHRRELLELAAEQRLCVGGAGAVGANLGDDVVTLTGGAVEEAERLTQLARAAVG